MKRVPSEEIEEGPDNRCYHDGVLFTGISYASFRTGELKRETEYRDGIPWGQQLTFRLDGSEESEGTLAAGYKEGYWRTWHPNGRLASEEWCHIGVALTSKKWDHTGKLLEDFVLPETDPRYLNMLEYRRIWGIGDQPVPRPPVGGGSEPPGGAH
jgi:antitoxin component YwqK of YwqJK toxin-antitoxin module